MAIFFQKKLAGMTEPENNLFCMGITFMFMSQVGAVKKQKIFVYNSLICLL